MRLVKVFSSLNALLFFICSAIIFGNDVLFGYKSSLPVVSTIVSILFLVIGLVIWGIGHSAGQLSLWVKPEGVSAYKALSRYLTGALTVCGLIALLAVYGLIERIMQGTPIFG